MALCISEMIQVVFRGVGGLDMFGFPEMQCFPTAQWLSENLDSTNERQSQQFRF